jgi:hypothetical protein
MDASNIDYLRYSQAERILTLTKSQGNVRIREGITLNIYPEYLLCPVER